MKKTKCYKDKPKLTQIKAVDYKFLKSIERSQYYINWKSMFPKAKWFNLAFTLKSLCWQRESLLSSLCSLLAEPRRVLNCHFLPVCECMQALAWKQESMLVGLATAKGLLVKKCQDLCF